MIELMFSVVIIVLVLTAVVALLVNSMGTRNKGYDRKKAAYIAEKIMEELVAYEDGSTSEFWGGSPDYTSFDTGDPDYTYSISEDNQQNCGPEVCRKEVEVTVTIPGVAVENAVKIRRLFAK